MVACEDCDSTMRRIFLLPIVYLRSYGLRETEDCTPYRLLISVQCRLGSALQISCHDRCVSWLVGFAFAFLLQWNLDSRSYGPRVQYTPHQTLQHFAIRTNYVISIF